MSPSAIYADYVRWCREVWRCEPMEFGRWYAFKGWYY